jgi:dihydrolipoamide dehydrogenase
MTSDDILELKELPRSLVVIGAGAVGIEFASIFARFDATVTVIELLPRILPAEDEEISAEAQKLLGKQMAIHTGAKTEAALKTPAGVEVAFKTSTGEAKTVTADILLVAVGRGPVTEGLNLESTRAQLERGFIKVNTRMETDEPGLFAIGDVVSVDGKLHPQLAHLASHEGIGVAERLAGKKTEPVNYDRVPGATYCRPEVASVGLSEAEARKRGRDVKVGRFPFGNLAKPRILGHDQGLVKVVSDARHDEVLGVHMLGPHATDLISEACVALQLETTTEEIAKTIHPHPTLPEALMQAAEAVYGHAIDA